MATKMTAFKINCPLLDHLSKEFKEHDLLCAGETGYDDYDSYLSGKQAAYDEMLTWAQGFVDISGLLSGSIESEVIDTHGKTLNIEITPEP